MRGAIAVALVYYYFDPKGMAEDSHRSTIIATTLILVLFSTVVFSAATKPLLEFMLGAGTSASLLMHTVYTGSAIPPTAVLLFAYLMLTCECLLAEACKVLLLLSQLMLTSGCLFAELADNGMRRRRLSGRVRSGKLQHHSDQYSGPPLYTVVTMDPNDEVTIRLLAYG